MLNFLKNYRVYWDRFLFKQKNVTLRRNLLSTSFSIILALLISFLIIISINIKPIAFISIFVKPFSWGYDTQKFAVQFSIYILAALAFAFGMYVGIFNIGISGQMLAGGIFAYYIILKTFPNSFRPEAGGQLITILLSIIGSCIVSLLIGVLKIYFKVNEVVSAILLNWIILYITGIVAIKENLVNLNNFGQGVFETKPLPQNFSLWLPNNFYGWQWSIGIAFVAVIVMFVLLKFTVLGHKLKTMGQNPFAASNFGYSKNRIYLLSFLISGIISGLLASVVFTASYERVISFQPLGGTALNVLPTQGFDGIAISLIALNNPIAIILVAFIFSFPNIGAAPANLPQSTISLVVGIMMYLIAIYQLLNYFKPYKSLIILFYKKNNVDNYINYENDVFENLTNYFLNKKKITKAAFNESLLKSKKDFSKQKKLMNHIYYLRYNWFLKWFDQNYHQKIKQLKNEYFMQRKNYVLSFKNNVVWNLISYWKNDVKIFKSNQKWHQYVWKKDRNRINKIHQYLKKSHQNPSYNLRDEYNLIETKLNLHKRNYDQH